MNVISSLSVTSYNGPVEKNTGANSVAISSVTAPARLTAIKNTDNSPQTPRQEPDQTTDRTGDKRSLRTSAASEAEYLPARYDGSDNERSTSSNQRPEIQAFLNTSTTDTASRRGRFIDIQA